MKRRKEDELWHRAERWLALILCALVMIASAAYIVRYERTRREIQRDNAAFSALYAAPSIGAEGSAAPTATVVPSATVVPTATTDPTATPAPTATTAPTAASTATPTAAPSATPTPTPTPESSATPTASPSPSPTPSPTPTPSPAPTATLEAVMDVAYTPRATADADTLVMAMETPPPVQESFADLLAINPDTVGFLSIDGVLELPVVQRLHDNEFYLDRAFDLSESIGGTLFLDGANLLAPEDDCLVIYGHNMRNGTMFGPLAQYADEAFAHAHPEVRFDTLYASRIWEPFAALTVTADPDSERYYDLRQFSFDEEGFDLFVRSLRALAYWSSPAEVHYGDKLLLLVTCEYTHDNGRFVLACRAVATPAVAEQ